MNENSQKYSTSTVLIVIVFLALIIALPPIVRVMYPKEETNENTTQKEEKSTTFTDGSLVCSIKYANTGLSIVSTANYQNSTITSNTLAFSNPNGYTSADLIESADGKTEFTSYSTFFSQFASLDSTYINTTDTLTTVSLNSELVSTNEALSNYFKPANELKSFFEGNSFTCSFE